LGLFFHLKKDPTEVGTPNSLKVAELALLSAKIKIGQTLRGISHPRLGITLLEAF
jgi:hypothetical protein